MGLLRELRSSLENPATPLSYPAEWLLDIFNGGRTDSGIRVSELTALQVTTVYTCVDIIAGSLAAQPLNVYEALAEDATRLAWEQELHFLLHDEPNPEMTSFTFRKTLQVHALLWGNLYGEIQRDVSNRPVAIWPRQPHKTKPRRASEAFSYRDLNDELATIDRGEMFYATTDGTGGLERVIKAGDMLHIPGLSLDGRLGREVIDMARQAIGLALAAEKFGGKFFANGLRPTGVVELPQKMSPQAIENYKRSLREAYGGENMMTPFVIEEGMKWTTVEIKANEAQYLETRKHQREEICALFHVPARMAGDSGKVNRNSSEQEGIEFVQYTLRPWVAPWEQELKRKLFPKTGRTAGKYFPGFDLEDLLLPDSDSRGKYFALGKQWGFFNTNDVRKKLRMNPVAGKAGNAYWMPVNMQDAADPMSAADGGGATGGPGDDDKPDPESEAQGRAHAHFFRDAFGRALSRDKREFGEFRLTFMPVMASLAESFREVEAAGSQGAEQPELTADLHGFVGEYLNGMFKRSSEWKNDEETSARELAKAARAIRVAVYRDLATSKAKALSAKESA